MSKEKVLELLKEGVQDAQTSGDVGLAQNIVGNNNYQAGRDINFKTEKVVKRTTVKTGDGVVTAPQKAELTSIKNEWISVHNAVKRSELSHSAAWYSFNRKFKINSYHELPIEKFEEAKKWLKSKIGAIRKMKSAKSKDPGWRNAAIRAIKARCKNQLSDEFAYMQYIKKNFEKSSLSALTDEELERVKAYISGKKPSKKNHGSIGCSGGAGKRGSIS